MLNTLPRLSIWELSCRINGYDPSEDFINKIPPSIRDTAKSLTRAFHYDDVSAISSRGIEGNTIRHSTKDKTYGPEVVHSKIAECYEDGVMDLDFLESIYIEDEHFVALCKKKNIPLPKFWFPYGYHHPFEDDENDTKKDDHLRSNQVDKLVCQAVGKTLWDIFPNMTITDMCNQKAIQIYGNGKQYKGAHTLRDWLSEIAPEEIKNRRGRPKKTQ